MPAEAGEPLLARVGHAAFVADVRALGRALAAEGWRPDVLIGIARGGLVPAVYLSHLLDLPMAALDPADAAAPAALAGRTRAGRRLLLVDDINDSGGTFAALATALAAAGADMARVRTAALIDNIRSPARIDYRARTIDRAADKRWFIFPWEALAGRATLLADARDVPGRLA